MVSNSFTVSQPFLGAPLHFHPALGSQELETLIDIFVPGTASKADKLSTVTIDFYLNATVDITTGALTKTFEVFPSIWTEQSFELSPCQSQSSGFSPAAYTPNSSSSASFGQDSGYGSFTMTPSTKSRGARAAKKPKKEVKQVDEARLPGFSIMTKDGIDMTSTAGRGTKTKEQREHAHLMRIMKACAECKRKKIRCDPSHRRSHNDMSRSSTSSASSTGRSDPSPRASVPSLSRHTTQDSSPASFSPSAGIHDFVLFPEGSGAWSSAELDLETQDINHFNFDITDVDFMNYSPINHDPHAFNHSPYQQSPANYQSGSQGLHMTVQDFQAGEQFVMAQQFSDQFDWGDAPDIQLSQATSSSSSQSLISEQQSSTPFHEPVARSFMQQSSASCVRQPSAELVQQSSFELTEADVNANAHQARAKQQSASGLVEVDAGTYAHQARASQLQPPSSSVKTNASTYAHQPRASQLQSPFRLIEANASTFAHQPHASLVEAASSTSAQQSPTRAVETDANTYAHQPRARPVEADAPTYAQQPRARAAEADAHTYAQQPRARLVEADASTSAQQSSASYAREVASTSARQSSAGVVEANSFSAVHQPSIIIGGGSSARLLQQSPTDSVLFGAGNSLSRSSAVSVDAGSTMLVQQSQAGQALFSAMIAMIFCATIASTFFGMPVMTSRVTDWASLAVLGYLCGAGRTGSVTDSVCGRGRERSSFGGDILSCIQEIHILAVEAFSSTVS